MFKRIFLIVLDSVGVGEALDASKFNDLDVNTFGHTVFNEKILDNMKNMGFYNIINNKTDKTIAYYTKAHPISNGKDTLTGHLEMMGVITKKPFKTFLENGFPEELIKELENRTNRKIIGNISASGTEIIEKYGEHQIKTGDLIVYTSADSVLQIAAHEDIIPLEELYKICEIARELTLKEEWKVGRVIARPYIGNVGNFVRTPNRHDYALNPTSKTVLDYLKEANHDVISIGKISDIFNSCGITNSIKTKDNIDGINKIIEIIKKDFRGLCFANLNDFDSKYGHRRDKEGYYNALKEFNDKIPDILNYLRYDDLLIITADHGNDPTYRGTDHTRENVPLIVYSKKFVSNNKLKERNSFSDIGATISKNFNVEIPYGDSFLDELR